MPGAPAAWIATAPGKVMLTGEYAVLDGAEAVVIAVDRRARAVLGAPTAPSEFLRAAAEVLGREVGADAARAIGSVHIDTEALRQDGVKLGLGSSAAATVAGIAAALHAVGAYARDRVATLAMLAHAEAQARRGAAGSGADIAASSRGGVIGFSRTGTRTLTLPAGLALGFAWTGAAADTATLVAAITAARAAPGAGAALAAIAAASTGFASAGDAPAAVRALAAGAAATQALADATGVALVPPAVVALQARLAGLGLVAKTTGAGGGDIVVIAGAGPVDAAALHRVLVDVGLAPLALGLDPTGVDIAPPAA